MAFVFDTVNHIEYSMELAFVKFHYLSHFGNISSFQWEQWAFWEVP